MVLVEFAPKLRRTLRRSFLRSPPENLFCSTRSAVKLSRPPLPFLFQMCEASLKTLFTLGVPLDAGIQKAKRKAFIERAFV